MTPRCNAMTAAVVMAAALLFCVALMPAPAAAALGDPIYPGTLVRLYAVGPSQWVRRSPTHSTNPVRAADNISQSQATLFLLEGGPSNETIPLPSTTINLIDAFSMTPYCEPRSGVSGWYDKTVMCRDTSDGPWLKIMAATYPNYVINSGDEVVFYNMRDNRWCAAPTWPTNNAGVYCDFFTTAPDNSPETVKMRFRIYSA